MTALKGLIKIAYGGSSTHAVDLILRPLGSLLSGVSQTTIPVAPLHTSFRDFLQDRKRSNGFFVDISKRDAEFAVTCLDIMQNTLRFNICGLESSYVDNNAVPDLRSRIEKTIPPDLSYACLFWADHLRSSPITPNIIDQVTLFMKTQFLHWWEVMSLTSAVPAAGAALQMLKNRFEVSLEMLIG